MQVEPPAHHPWLTRTSGTSNNVALGRMGTLYPPRADGKLGAVDSPIFRRDVGGSCSSAFELFSLRC